MATTLASIPASQIVSVTPGVLAAGGDALDLSGLLLTTSTRAPIGSVLSFPTAASVAAFFGPVSAEAAYATVYFLGFTNSNRKPGAMLFAQYPTAPVAAWLHGGTVAGTPLATFQAMSGTLSAIVDGVNKSATFGSGAFAGATSLSAIAAIIAGQLGVGVAYDSTAAAFFVTSNTIGASSTMSFASGTLAALLGLNQASGGTLSQGAVAATPSAFMQGVLTQTQDWASFTTTFEPSTDDKVNFAAWTNGTVNNYLYVCWDTDVTATQIGINTCAGVRIKTAGFSGTSVIYKDPNVAVFLLGAVASLDFQQTNGRATLAFKGQTGLTATVTDAAVAVTLMSNGYSFYGAYGTANDRFLFLYNGQVSGPFLWIDSYVNQIWLNNQFQLDLMVLMTTARSIPYNDAGYALIEASLLDTITAGLNFGAIRAGVTLSSLQAASVNSSAGLKIDTVLSTRGWYLQVKDAAPQVRANRQSPPCTFWYTDGQSVQGINLASINVQ